MMLCRFRHVSVSESFSFFVVLEGLVLLFKQFYI
jgi:hypothetical protein